jgi:hypothetical protein
MAIWQPIEVDRRHPKFNGQNGLASIDQELLLRHTLEVLKQLQEITKGSAEHTRRLVCKLDKCLEIAQELEEDEAKMEQIKTAK